MKAHYLNPLISSVASVLQSMAKVEPKKGSMAKKEVLETKKDVTVIFNIEGDLNGYFTLGFSKNTAMKIVETMTVGMGGTGELDELGISCLVELAGIARGKMAKELKELDYTCEIKQGELIFLENFPLYPSEITLEYQLDTGIGEVELNIALYKKKLA